MKPLLALLVLAAFTGCESVNVGLTYAGKYGNYTVMRRTTQGVVDWNILVSADGKQLIEPLHPTR